MERRTETIDNVSSRPSAAGTQNLGFTVDRLLNDALRVHRDNAAGVAWVEGEYRGEWIELRVTIRKRPEQTTEQPQI